MPYSADTARRILQAYGYTAKTLAIDLEVSPAVAKRILYGTHDLFCGDIQLFHDCILGVSIDFLFGRINPGEMKQERKRREAERAEAERKAAEEKAECDATSRARDEAWRRMTPQEKCAETARVLVPILCNCERYGYTIADVFDEIIKQVKIKEQMAGVAV